MTDQSDELLAAAKMALHLISSTIGYARISGSILYDEEIAAEAALRLAIANAEKGTEV